MILKQKIVNYKVSLLFEIYKVYLKSFSIRGCLKVKILKISIKNAVLHDKINSNEKVTKYKIS